jgi:integrase
MSALRKGLNDYLAVRRAFGYQLREAGGGLRHFVTFVERHGTHHITTELALRWATQPHQTDPAHWARRLGMVRGFAQYYSATDPRTEVPPHGLLPYRYRRRTPYIYRQGEIARLLGAARKLPSHIGLRPWTYSTLFGLLTVTGMRISEVIRLDRDDVDLTRGLLTIVRSKFRKSRLIPIHASTGRALRRYADRRDRVYRWPTTPSFFLSDLGTRLTHWSVRQTFVRLSHQIGLRGPADRHGPRIHDLRHGFAIRTLLGWYRAGVDVERRLPVLATYLGHRHVADTYWYLSGVPELFRLVARRLDGSPGGAKS